MDQIGGAHIMISVPVVVMGVPERIVTPERARSFVIPLRWKQTEANLVNARPIQHFGTTSLIGFFETPEGCAGSYDVDSYFLSLSATYSFGRPDVSSAPN